MVVASYWSHRLEPRSLQVRYIEIRKSLTQHGELRLPNQTGRTTMKHKLEIAAEIIFLLALFAVPLFIRSAML